MDRYLSDSGPFRGTPTRPNLRSYEGDWWKHQVVGAATPRGNRYQSVVSDGTGRILYRTRWYVHLSDAYETGRGVAVHHNVFPTCNVVDCGRYHAPKGKQR